MNFLFGLAASLENANAGENEIQPVDREVLENRIKTISSKLDSATIDEVEELSAELRTLIKFYKHDFNHPQDIHYILTTDTWLGEQTGKLVAQ